LIVACKIVQLEAEGVLWRERATAVTAHIAGRIQGHRVHAFQPALQGVGIVD